ncbi:MAG: GTP 3',8-cyclase MoaA [Nitrospirae bacterium]|nr:GTP 3',8-cyclase MoaA [Nitrospirota bacterium]
MDSLIDNYNRELNYLRISITDKCNLRCFYCMPNKNLRLIPHDEILRYEEILRVVRLAVNYGMKKIRITGGEPLIRKGVVEFIRSLSGISGIEDISLTTNGILLKELASDLLGAGIKSINISLDSLNPQRYKRLTGGDYLAQVLEGIKETERVGFDPIKINTVVIKGVNDDEVVDFAKITLDKPYKIRFIEFMPTAMIDSWSEDRFLPSDSIREQIERFEKLYPVTDQDKSRPSRGFRLKNGIGDIGFISPISHHFCSSCNRLRLTADGKLRPCLFSDDEIDIKRLLRNNAADDEIIGQLKLSAQQKSRGHMIREDIFQKCNRPMSAIGG